MGVFDKEIEEKGSAYLKKKDVQGKWTSVEGRKKKINRLCRKGGETTLKRKIG